MMESRVKETMNERVRSNNELDWKTSRDGRTERINEETKIESES
ncbi:MAG: hypothetical protein QXG08_05275 [Candidatus Methanomethyliaceae archaeon]